MPVFLKRTSLILSFLSLVALIAILFLIFPSTVVDAALDEAEPPSQYEDWDSAYDLTPSELGTPFDVRREGGGDRDFIRMDFLSLGDVVSVELDNYGDPSSSVEYWIYDPGRFPVAYANYEGSGPTNITLRFIALVAGAYHFSTAQGFGDTVIEVNITVETGSSMSDGNDRPEEAVDISGTMVVNGTIGQPGDPADFYRLMIDPSPALKTFLSFSLSGRGWTRAQWELYDSSGILESYYGAIVIGGQAKTFDEQIMDPGPMYIRLWCLRGSGDYKLYVNIQTYPEDGDDAFEGAQELMDGQTVNGTLHTRFDKSDHMRVSVSVGDTILLTMDVDDDADLFLITEDGYQVADSDNWDNESERISYRVPEGGNDTYYVLVTLSTELDPMPYRVINYSLHVVLNLPPELDPDFALTYSNWPMLEDWVDEGILLTNLFHDPEGRSLEFRVVPGHDESFLMASVTGAMRLRLEPAENVSGFVEAVTVEAADPAGKTARFTVFVAVNPVNDAPVAVHPTANPPPEVLEVPEDGTGGPWDVLFWFWDSDDVSSRLAFEFECGPEVGARTDELDRMYLDAMVADWNGWTNLTIRVRDPEGLGALLRIPVHVLPVNDAPRRTQASIAKLVGGGVDAMISVQGLFVTVDGDVLSYDATSDIGLTFTVDGVTMKIDGLQPYQNQTVVVEVTASDPYGATSEPVRIDLEVGELEEPHQVYSSRMEYTVVRGRSIYFTDVSVVDPDPGVLRYHCVLSIGDWYDPLDGVRNEAGWNWIGHTPKWTPDDSVAEGDYVAKLWVSDEWFKANVSWTIHVRAVNAPPEVLGLKCDGDSPYHVGDVLTFRSEVFDEDGDQMFYEWYLDGDLVGEGLNVTLTLETTGEHKVTIAVTDGLDSTEASFDLTVVRESGDNSDLLMFLLAGSTVAIVVVVIALVRGRGNGPNRPSR